MNPTTLFIPTLVVVSTVIGRWLLRRNPEVSKRQIFAASAALIGGVLSASNPTGSAVWFYVGISIASVMASFLLMTFLRHWDKPRPSGST
jgi:hypothetical protein